MEYPSSLFSFFLLRNAKPREAEKLRRVRLKWSGIKITIQWEWTMVKSDETLNEEKSASNRRRTVEKNPKERNVCEIISRVKSLQ